MPISKDNPETLLLVCELIIIKKKETQRGIQEKLGMVNINAFCNKNYLQLLSFCLITHKTMSSYSGLLLFLPLHAAGNDNNK